MSNSLQSESCCIGTLNLFGIPSAIGDDGMKALARGLAHNTSLKSLRLGVSQFPNNDDTVPPEQWLSLSNALCDTSSVNNTYLSNHTIHAIMDRYDTTNFRPEDIDLYLRLNEQHPEHAARCKILMTHPHLDMQCFLQWDLKLLPVVPAWFEQAKTCTTLNVQRSVTDTEWEAEALVERRVVEESDKVFGSRVLSAMYEFVRSAPMQVMESRNVFEFLLSTTLAFFIYFRVLKTSGASNVVLVTFLVPVSASALGIALLGEVLAIQHILAYLLIALGLAIIDGRIVARLAQMRLKSQL